MSNWKNYIIVCLFSILIIFGIGTSIRCARLEKENLKLKQENLTVLDSIEMENNTLNKKISRLNIELKYYEDTIDSLDKVKQRIIFKREYIMTDNIDESVSKLKENLCEN